MNKWILQILTIIGPAVVVMIAMFIFEPDNGIPEPFWNTDIAFVMGSMLISVPQIMWAAICSPGLLSKEVYWGGLIAVQSWLIAYGIWGVGYVRSHSDGEDIWFGYFPVCIVVIPFGALCGSLLRKFRHKGPVA